MVPHQLFLSRPKRNDYLPYRNGRRIFFKCELLPGTGPLKYMMLKRNVRNDFMKEEFEYYFIDLFCGAGGTSTGILKHAKVIWCINHDKNAIKSHAANHPECVHSTEDIRFASLDELLKLINKIRSENPKAVICLWASLECTNHSNAKGGMSRDADSRTLADHLFRYLDILDPDMIWIENVREFKDWGKLKIKHKERELYCELLMSKPTKKKPVSEYIMVPNKNYKAVDFNRWVGQIRSYGYNYDHRILNAADYGCDTSRKRLFIQFAKPHLKISWPDPTHDKNSKNGLSKWRPVKNVLDLNDEGVSIFDRKKPYVDPSLSRFLRGLKKFGQRSFLVKYYGNGDNTASIEEPSPTLTTKDRLYFIKSDYSGGGQARSIEEPFPSLQTVPKQSVVDIRFLIDNQYKNNGSGLDVPCPTLIARMDKAPKILVTALNGDLSIKSTIYKDSKVMPDILDFMKVNNISDIKVRPLRIREMLTIMGFPVDYKLIGTQTEQKKYIGNAVPCHQVSALIKHSKEINYRLLN